MSIFGLGLLIISYSLLTITRPRLFRNPIIWSGQSQHSSTAEKDLDRKVFSVFNIVNLLI